MEQLAVALGIDPFRTVLALAAWVRLACGLGGLASGLAYLLHEDAYLNSTESALWGTGAFVLAPTVIHVAALRSLVSLWSLEKPLDRDGAFHRWGGASIVDAFMLVPWFLFAAPSVFGPLIMWAESPSPALMLSLLACALAGIMHVVVLPSWLLAAHDQAALTEGASTPAPQRDPIRVAFATMARRKVFILLLAPGAFLLPWMSYDNARSRLAVWQVASTTMEPARDELLLGVELVAGVGGAFAGWSTLKIVVSLLVLLFAAIWECRRARWRGAPRWTQTRVFAAWCLLLVVSALPTYEWYLGCRWLFGYPSPHVGYWLCAIALVVYVVNLIAFTPLAAWQALQRRAEAERESELRDRPTGIDANGVDPDDGAHVRG